MRLLKLIVLIILISSCANEMEIKLRTLRKNNNNLPEIKRFFGLNHTWKMSSWFIKQDTTQDYNYPDLTEPCISKRNQGYEIKSLNVYCTVEQLSQQELDDIHFIQGQATRIISIREHYLQRLKTIMDFVLSSSICRKNLRNIITIQQDLWLFCNEKTNILSFNGLAHQLLIPTWQMILLLS